MAITRVPAVEALARLDSFSTVIDARSEDEFALDHLPGAVNWPTLRNEERRIVGTTYKQISGFEARKRGAAMAARNISQHIEREVLVTSNAISHQLQPDVLPQLGQAWQEPARCIWTPHCMQ